MPARALQSRQKRSGALGNSAPMRTLRRPFISSSDWVYFQHVYLVYICTNPWIQFNFKNRFGDEIKAPELAASRAQHYH